MNIRNGVQHESCSQNSAGELLEIHVASQSNQLAPEKPVSGVLTLLHRGAQSSIQVNIEVSGIDSADVDIETSPILPPRSETKIPFVIHHSRRAFPPAGKHQIHFCVKANASDVNEQTKVAHTIIVGPIYRHALRMLPTQYFNFAHFRRTVSGLLLIGLVLILAILAVAASDLSETSRIASQIFENRQSAPIAFLLLFGIGSALFVGQRHMKTRAQVRLALCRFILTNIGNANSHYLLRAEDSSQKLSFKFAIDGVPLDPPIVSAGKIARTGVADRAGSAGRSREASSSHPPLANENLDPLRGVDFNEETEMAPGLYRHNSPPETSITVFETTTVTGVWPQVMEIATGSEDETTANGVDDQRDGTGASSAAADAREPAADGWVLTPSIRPGQSLTVETLISSQELPNNLGRMPIRIVAQSVDDVHAETVVHASNI